MNQEQRAELVELTERFVDAFNRQDLDDVMSFFAEGAIYDDAYGHRHEGKAAIRAAFTPVMDGTIGRIRFDGEDRFIDAGAESGTGKVMDSWLLHMHIGEGEGKEGTLRGLDLLHFDAGQLVRKVTYKRDQI